MLTQEQKYKRGTESEQNVFDALTILRKVGFIQGFIKTDRFSRDDQHGVDFRIFIEAPYHKIRVDIPLQVKSSECGVSSHYEKNGQNIFAVNGQSRTLEMDLKTIIISVRRLFNIKPPTILTIDQQQLILTLIEQGRTLEQVGGVVGIPASNLVRLMKKYPDVYRAYKTAQAIARDGYKVIKYRKEKDLYYAYVRVNNQKKFIAAFITEQEAYEACVKACKLIYGTATPLVISSQNYKPISYNEEAYKELCLELRANRKKRPRRKHHG